MGPTFLLDDARGLGSVERNIELSEQKVKETWKYELKAEHFYVIIKSEILSWG